MSPIPMETTLCSHQYLDRKILSLSLALSQKIHLCRSFWICILYLACSISAAILGLLVCVLCSLIHLHSGSLGRARNRALSCSVCCHWHSLCSAAGFPFSVSAIMYLVSVTRLLCICWLNSLKCLTFYTIAGDLQHFCCDSERFPQSKWIR